MQGGGGVAGGGRAKSLAEHRASSEKCRSAGVGGGGGTPTHFLFRPNYHKGVGVLSLSPYVTELTSKKTTKPQS